MRDVHRVALPPDAALAGMDRQAQLELFAQFLAFLKRNLNGQTTLPTHAGWASQSEVIAGFSRVASPDMLIHEDLIAEANCPAGPRGDRRRAPGGAEGSADARFPARQGPAAGRASGVPARLHRLRVFGLGGGPFGPPARHALSSAASSACFSRTSAASPSDSTFRRTTGSVFDLRRLNRHLPKFSDTPSRSSRLSACGS